MRVDRFCGAVFRGAGVALRRWQKDIQENLSIAISRLFVG
jgi:hypothetical protein